MAQPSWQGQSRVAESASALNLCVLGAIDMVIVAEPTSVFGPVGQAQHLTAVDPLMIFPPIPHPALILLNRHAGTGIGQAARR
jgi:hypothetical protein